MIRGATTDTIRPIRVIAMLLIIAALYFAREILIPAAMAVLLTFLLYPMVTRLRRWGLNRVAAVVLTVTLAGAMVGGIGFVVTQQVLDLTSQLPDYRDNLRQKVREIRSSGEGTLSKLSGTIKELQEELASTQPATQPMIAASPVGPVIAAPAPKALPVEIADDDWGVGSIAAAMATPLFDFIAGGAMTSLLVIFLLLYSDDVRERLIAFAGMRQISLTTSAMDEAGQRIGRYLRMQALVNAAYGAMIAVGLAMFGVPNWLLWGVFGFLLRFVPYLGPWLAAILPTLLAIAVFPGWARPIGVISMFCVAELVTNLILEPWLYGSSAGISSLGVVCAAFFWAWVWGPVGLILAVPVTACLVVMGKHIPQLALLHQLFGTDVTVPVVGRLYQRLLVGDEDSVEEIIDEAVKDTSMAHACDSLVFPALSELKRDAAGGLIPPAQVRRALDIINMICDSNAESADEPPRLIFVAAQNELDDSAARLLTCMAGAEGISTEMISSRALSSEAAQRAGASGAAHVVIVQIPPVSLIHSRRLIKALSQKLQSTQEIVDFAPRPPRTANAAPARSRAGDDGVREETSVEQLIAQIRERAAVKEKPAPDVEQAAQAAPA